VTIDGLGTSLAALATFSILTGLFVIITAVAVVAHVVHHWDD
jgi:hypothetical protein